MAGLLILGGVAWLVVRRQAQAKADRMAGYISDMAVLEREYVAANGKLLDNVEARNAFQRAAQLLNQGDVQHAADLLETARKNAAVPVVFNDLGVLYAQLQDRSRTVNCFREALARDPHYRPVLQNLVRLRGITEDEARPLSREIEPNSTNSTANVIAVGTPVEGEISAGGNDIDTFKFPAPPAPRDTLSLEISTFAPGLVMGWNLYDDSGHEIGRVHDQPKPGAPVQFSFGPLPNATFYLSVWGIDGTNGPYKITLTALKAFDSYEPDDDIFHARPIALGQAIQANIMDGQDQDFYSFVADRSGTVDIALDNRSSTLLPALTAFGPDQRTIGFAPDASGAGGSLRYSIPVTAGQTYYVQVWPVLDHSGGEYTLRLDLR